MGFRTLPVSDSTGGFLSLLRVSTRCPFVSKGEFVFLPVASKIIGQPGSDHAVVDATPHIHDGWPGHPRWVPERDTE